MEGKDPSEEPAEEEPRAADAEEVEAAEQRGPSSKEAGRPRIEGVEAGVAAGLVPSTGAPEGGRPVPRPRPQHLARTDTVREEPLPREIVEGVELPDWTDPPTREVPKALLDPDAPEGPSIPEPVWRESQADFDQDSEAFAEMVSGSVPIVPHDEDVGDLSYEEFSFTGDEAAAAPPDPWSELGEPTQAIPVQATPTRARTLQEAPAAKRGGRSPLVATATGVLFGAVALVCFLIGPDAVLAIASLALLLAAAELFGALRSARYRPAALVGIVAAPGFAVAAFEKGPMAIPVVLAIAVVATLVWYLAGVTRRDVVANISVTMLGIGWIAVLGSFVGLLLDPSVFPDRHGLAYLLGALEATVAYDVGGYLVGSLVGRHKLAPSLSPNKTIEGLAGGCVAAFVVGLLLASQTSPWTLSRGAALGVVVAIVAPIGDLVESMIKRDLKLKDMGHLLPAHGGLLDRIDAILFVLPATYFLVRLFNG